VRNLPAWVPVLELPVLPSRSASRLDKNVYEEIFDFIKERQTRKFD
jgi:hypothetical protein